MKQELHAIQTRKSSWAIETDTKMVDLKKRSTRKSLRFEGIGARKWILGGLLKQNLLFIGKKLEMDIESVVIKEALRNRKKKNNRSSL